MSYHHLTGDERNVIWQMRRLGKSRAEIARCLGRHRSTIGRELRRNAAFPSGYDPAAAQALAGGRRRAHVRRPKTGDRRLMAYVAVRLQRRWSPEQIAGRLRQVGVKALDGRTISHTTIYRWIWADPERSRRFRPYLRVAAKPRRKPYGKPSQRGPIPHRTPIDARPEAANQRRRLGDWEGDTLVGKGRTAYVVTSVDRASRYLVARKIPACSAAAANRALHGGMRRLPRDRRHTLTADNGPEFAGHEPLGRLLGLDVYFAHPYHSWERGTNENTNGLLRQYLPKTMPFDPLTDRQLASYVRQMNHRPRKCLAYRTPAEVFWRRPVALTM